MMSEDEVVTLSELLRACGVFDHEAVECVIELVANV